jgi:hypothetical protein
MVAFVAYWECHGWCEWVGNRDVVDSGSLDCMYIPSWRCVSSDGLVVLVSLSKCFCAKFAILRRNWMPRLCASARVRPLNPCSRSFEALQNFDFGHWRSTTSTRIDTASALPTAWLSHPEAEVVAIEVEGVVGFEVDEVVTAAVAAVAEVGTRAVNQRHEHSRLTRRRWIWRPRRKRR